MQKPKTSYSVFEQHILAVFLIVFVCICITFDFTKKLDNIFYDLYIQLFPQSVPSDVVIIAVDEQSLIALGQWPWQRSLHAQLLDTLIELPPELQPEAIVFDIIFAEEDQKNPDNDFQLAGAMNESGRVLIPVHIHPLSNRETLAEITPIAPLAEAAVGMGHAHVELDDDGITRGLYLNVGMGQAYWSALSLATLDWIRGKKRSPLKAFSSSQRTSPYVNIRENYVMIPFAGGAGSITTYSYIDILTGDIGPEVFSGKVVFIGSTAAGLGDFLSTPVSGLSSPMSGVEFHANVYSALQEKTVITLVPRYWHYLLSVAFVLISVLLIPRIKPERTLPVTLTILILVLSFSFIVLHQMNQWYEPTPALIAILAAYPLWSWRRISELNRFLNQELETLSMEPKLSHRRVGNFHPPDLLDAVIFLLNPKGWYCSLNSDVIKHQHLDRHSELDSMTPGFWLHKATESWICFSLADRHWVIGLQWSEDNHLDQKRAFLHRILLLDKLDQPGSTVFAPTERLAHRINQVQEAILNMRDMRRFVSEGFDRMPDGVIVTDPVGSIIFANSHSELMLEQPRQTLLGQPLQRILSSFTAQDPDAWQPLFTRVLLQARVHSMEVRLAHLDLLLQFAPFETENPGEAGMIVNLSNITQFKEEQRRRNETIDFLSHDVRSPLVSQLALLDNIESGITAVSDETFGQIRSHAIRSLNLADQFLQIARAEQVESDSFYDCNLIDILLNATDSCMAKARQKDIHIDFDPDMDDCWVKGNPELLERLFINLIGNALKYSPATTTVSVEITENQEGTHQQSDLWHVTISDQGIGIDPDEIDGIFDRFKRQKKSETQGEKGAGLGLRFVKVVVEKHQGTINVASTPKLGSTFCVSLPKLDYIEPA
ncbi:CHASE2 and PAS sensor-containing signal transduction histidine kinase [Oleiphilus messinensis]|uniref:histidine kinase n=1 Tax=Oleiphilus messinensis TaxID=141451 RepID=A0A1Y0I9R4_9GAMM|nr:CHASE2 domain-containing protein [Oleiphilus messinensis]ARU57201.1 CHASE2 and PAS sensor-containing signal transduction histidine kinase [Oleiphilus messinensis]